MVGVVLDGHRIAVDYWQRSPGISSFFLSHMHADHTVGLKPSWNMGRIYCTAISKRILCHKFQIDPSIVSELEYNTATMVRVGPSDNVTVTAFDANHCPGSAMFLFQGAAGNVLYTGDFRYSSHLVDSFNHPLFLRAVPFSDTQSQTHKQRHSQPQCKGGVCVEKDLTPFGHPPIVCSTYSGSDDVDAADIHATSALVIDLLYLDNTYCSPLHESVPSRADAANRIVEIATDHPQCRILVAVDTLGKEEMLAHLARALDERVGVSPSRMATIAAIGGIEDGVPDVFTTDPLARVRVVQRHAVTTDALEKWNEECPTILVMATGMPLSAELRNWRPTQPTDCQRFAHPQTAPLTSSEEIVHADELVLGPAMTPASHVAPLQYVHAVPYSLHSSFSELRAFVSRLSVRKIRPIVPGYNADVEGHFAHLLLPPSERSTCESGLPAPANDAHVTIAHSDADDRVARERAHALARQPSDTAPPIAVVPRSRTRNLVEAVPLVRRNSGKGPAFAGLKRTSSEQQLKDNGTAVVRIAASGVESAHDGSSSTSSRAVDTSCAPAIAITATSFEWDPLIDNSAFKAEKFRDDDSISVLLRAAADAAELEEPTRRTSDVENVPPETAAATDTVGIPAPAVRLDQPRRLPSSFAQKTAPPPLARGMGASGYAAAQPLLQSQSQSQSQPQWRTAIPARVASVRDFYSPTQRNGAVHEGGDCDDASFSRGSEYAAAAALFSAKHARVVDSATPNDPSPSVSSSLAGDIGGMDSRGVSVLRPHSQTQPQAYDERCKDSASPPPKRQCTDHPPPPANVTAFFARFRR